MSTATVTRVSVDGLSKGLKGGAQRSNSDGSKSASELYDHTGGATTLQGDLPSSDLPWEPVTEIDNKDVGTPDQWIPRHPDLIRLTGRYRHRVRPFLQNILASCILGSTASPDSPIAC